jgi:ATP-binding cassette subfamily B protein
MVRETRNLEEFSHLADTMFRHAFQNQLYEAMFLPLVLSIIALGVGLALWRGGVQVSVGGLTVGKLVAFLQFATFLQHPAQELARTITMVQGAQASAERLQGCSTPIRRSSTRPTCSKRFAVPLPTEHPASRSTDMPGRSSRSSSATSPSPTKAGQSVLQDFNLTVRAGETIALVGPTGGGKTTIVGLACRSTNPRPARS